MSETHRHITRVSNRGNSQYEIFAHELKQPKVKKKKDFLEKHPKLIFNKTTKRGKMPERMKIGKGET